MKVGGVEKIPTVYVLRKENDVLKVSIKIKCFKIETILKKYKDV
jgi:hypothetical protein